MLTPSMQPSSSQSSWISHDSPIPQAGQSVPPQSMSVSSWFFTVSEQVGTWQLPPVHTLEVQSLATESVDAPQRVEQRERVERLYEAIHQLPQTDIALVLLYLDELSYREMANVLGISESNVGVRLNRAKKTLAKLLDAEPVEGKADESR